MQIPRHSDEAKEQFISLVTTSESVIVRPMFGSVGAFVEGRMFAGLFGDDIGVKLDPAGLAELSAIPGSGPFGPTDGRMSRYRSLPVGMPDAEKRAWIQRAREYVASLPPKPTRTEESR